MPQLIADGDAENSCGSRSSAPLAHGLFLGAALMLLVVSLTSATTVQLAPAGGECPDGFDAVKSAPLCRAAMELVGHQGDEFYGTESEPDWPTGCYRMDGKETYLNVASPGSNSEEARLYCVDVEDGFQKGRTLFMGDSDIDYWDTAAGVDAASYNVGVGGYTCRDVLAELSQYLQAFKPSRVVLVCGENDLGEAAGVSETLQQWTSIIDGITAAGIPVTFLGTKPEPSTASLHSEYQDYDSLIKAWVNAQQEGAEDDASVTFIDVYPAFEALGNPLSLYDDDRLHLSSEGYSLWNTWTRMAIDNPACVLWQSGECLAEKRVVETPASPVAGAALISAPLVLVTLCLFVALHGWM